MFRDAEPVAWTFHHNTGRWVHNAAAAAAGSELPDPPKEYPTAPMIPLPGPEFPPATLEAAIRTRLSCRRFGPDALSSVQLSTVLAAAYGVGERFLVMGSEVGERPVPSGGGLYPLELYLLVRAVDGLDPGIYHYATLLHGLEQLVAAPFEHFEAANLFLGQPYVGDASAVIVITTVVERSLKKYGDRGYRYILFEAGHVAQNVNLTAAALGLGTCNLGGFFDDDVTELLGLDGDEEIPLYGIALGMSAATDRAGARFPAD